MAEDRFRLIDAKHLEWATRGVQFVRYDRRWLPFKRRWTREELLVQQHRLAGDLQEWIDERRAKSLALKAIMKEYEGRKRKSPNSPGGKNDPSNVWKGIPSWAIQLGWMPWKIGRRCSSTCCGQFRLSKT